MIVLDWTRPGGMAKELITWLRWIEEWAGGSDDSEEMRDRRELWHLHSVVMSKLIF